jgi:hypothetical protein
MMDQGYRYQVPACDLVLDIMVDKLGVDWFSQIVAENPMFFDWFNVENENED